MARNSKWHLTTAEETIMNILWDSKTPLMKSEIVEKAIENNELSWQERSCFTIINHLMEKGLIEVKNWKRAGKAKARTFAAAVSRPEYYAGLVVDCVPAEEQKTLRRKLREITSQ